MRVLVVEDNQDLAKLFCDLLQVMGCETEMAFNARSALETARQTAPDLVFCDLRLPGGKDGFDVARELRADHSFTGIRLIAVSGSVDEDERRRAFEAGFERVFVKPVKFAEMQEVLEHYRHA
jgi:CheY-like chemotaxis protein